MAGSGWGQTRGSWRVRPRDALELADVAAPWRCARVGTGQTLELSYDPGHGALRAATWSERLGRNCERIGLHLGQGIPNRIVGVGDDYVAIC